MLDVTALLRLLRSGEAPVSACPVGGAPVASKIAAIMGEEVGEMKKMVAFVKCNGTNENRQVNYNYVGIDNCAFAAQMPGSGPFACEYGCLGYGSCAKICDKGAIKVVNGKAVVDEALCVACGKCVKVCPHNLIEIIPADGKHRVQCSSQAKGKDVRNACSVGCIGCGICVKNCPNDAIVVENNVARIDYDKCTHCGACVEKCPRKIINL